MAAGAPDKVKMDRPAEARPEATPIPGPLRIPDAAFQVMRLPAYEPWMTGTLVYSEAFWRHDCVGRRDPDA